MGKYLAVLTATLFLFALIKCCFAAGGSTPSEDPGSAYLVVLITKTDTKDYFHCMKLTVMLYCIICSKLLYDLTCQDSSYPTESVDCRNQ